MKRKLCSVIVILSAAMLILLAFCLFTEGEDIRDGCVFLLSSGDREENIRLWEDEDGTLYCFLPSYADTSRLSLEGKGAMIDGKAAGEFDFSQIVFDKEYSFSRFGRSAPLVFMRSANVSSLFLDTRSGSMKQLSEDRDNTDPSCMRLYRPDGSLDFSEERFGARLEGHGNSSWSLEKKPYEFDLPSVSPLLGMPSGRRWVLVSNGYDPTNLRNKLAYDSAQKGGFAWCPRCEYVDLYLNGDYAGLYLLTEDWDIGPDKIDISPEDGILLARTGDGHTRSLPLSFVTDSGRLFYIRYPKYCAVEEKNAVMAYVRQLESSMQDGTWEQYFDADSLARRALLEIIFCNDDLYSFNYYWDRSDSRVYAGFPWDYDLAFGNQPWRSGVRNKNYTIGAPPDYYEGDSINYWWKLLMNDSAFTARLCALYESTFRSLMTDILSGGLDELAEQIGTASRMNSARWHRSFDALILHPTAEDIRTALTVRRECIDRFWIEKEPCVGVSFQNYTTFYIPFGECFGELPENSLFPIPEDAFWLDEKTGLPFDPSLPLKEDVSLVPSKELPTTQEEPPQEESFLFSLRSFIAENTTVTFCLCVIFVFGLILLTIDIKRNRRWR